MESLTSTSSVSAPQASHHDEIFMQHRMIFTENLNELKNLKKQLNSAAEYFELSYRKDDQKQIVVETLKDYTIKAFINTVDHLGSMADKVNNFMNEKVLEVSRADPKLCCIEQRLRTCQDFIDRRGFFQQSLALNFPKHHKRYIIPVGSSAKAVDQSTLTRHSVEDDWFQLNNATTKEMSPTTFREEYYSTSAVSPQQSSTQTFQLMRMASKKERQEVSPSHFPLLRSGSVIKRSTTTNSSSSKQRCQTEPWRSVTMCIHPERDRDRDRSPEQHSGFNRRLLKALVSMKKYRKDVTLHTQFNEN